MIDISRIRAITLDLDDTLWPIWPTIHRAEEVLSQWLMQHAPATAVLSGQPDIKKAVREDINARHADKAHDLSFLRLEAIRALLLQAGDPAQCLVDRVRRCRIDAGLTEVVAVTGMLGGAALEAGFRAVVEDRNAAHGEQQVRRVDEPGIVGVQPRHVVVVVEGHQFVGVRVRPPLEEQRGQDRLVAGALAAEHPARRRRQQREHGERLGFERLFGPAAQQAPAADCDCGVPANPRGPR